MLSLGVPRLLLKWSVPLADGSVETLNPSEDGEALQRIMQRDLPAEGKFMEDHALQASASLQWFAVYTTCRHEKRVAQHLSQRDVEYYLPLYRSERKWRDGSRVTLDLPLFPSYIFVHIGRSERVQVLSVPGALAVVGGTGREPAPIADTAIDVLRAGLEQGCIEPHPLLTVGQRARIRSGAFAGMEGVVVRKKSSFRVVLTLELIMQSIAVEVDEADLEPLGTGKLMPVGITELNSALCLLGA